MIVLSFIYIRFRLLSMLFIYLFNICFVAWEALRYLEGFCLRFAYLSIFLFKMKKQKTEKAKIINKNKIKTEKKFKKIVLH